MAMLAQQELSELRAASQPGGLGHWFDRNAKSERMAVGQEERSETQWQGSISGFPHRYLVRCGKGIGAGKVVGFQKSHNPGIEAFVAAYWSPPSWVSMRGGPSLHPQLHALLSSATPNGIDKREIDGGEDQHSLPW